MSKSCSRPLSKSLSSLPQEIIVHAKGVASPPQVLSPSKMTKDCLSVGTVFLGSGKRLFLSSSRGPRLSTAQPPCPSNAKRPPSTAHHQLSPSNVDSSFLGSRSRETRTRLYFDDRADRLPLPLPSSSSPESSSIVVPRTAAGRRSEEQEPSQAAEAGGRWREERIRTAAPGRRMEDLDPTLPTESRARLRHSSSDLHSSWREERARASSRGDRLRSTNGLIRSSADLRRSKEPSELDVVHELRRARSYAVNYLMRLQENGLCHQFCGRC